MVGFHDVGKDCISNDLGLGRIGTLQFDFQAVGVFLDEDDQFGIFRKETESGTTDTVQVFDQLLAV